MTFISLFGDQCAKQFNYPLKSIFCESFYEPRADWVNMIILRNSATLIFHQIFILKGFSGSKKTLLQSRYLDTIVLSYSIIIEKFFLEILPKDSQSDQSDHCGAFLEIVQLSFFIKISFRKVFLLVRRH